MVYADLHTHTTYSDGLSTPELNVILAVANGVEAVAIADHDNLRGIERGRALAQRWGIEFVPAVELTTDRYHILGYCFDEGNQAFLEYVERSRLTQVSEVEAKIARLTDAGYPLGIDDVYAAFGEREGRIGSLNINMALLRNYSDRLGGMTLQQVRNDISRPLTRGINVPIPHWREAIDAIHAAGGLAVFAHPPRDVDSLDDVIEVIGYGIDGLEVQPNFYDHDDGTVTYRQIEQLAREHGLLITAGSDYHGSLFAHRPLLTRGRYDVKPFWRNPDEYRVAPSRASPSADVVNG